MTQRIIQSHFGISCDCICLALTDDVAVNVTVEHNDQLVIVKQRGSMTDQNAVDFCLRISQDFLLQTLFSLQGYLLLGPPQWTGTGIRALVTDGR